ncbi:MAG: hypothetical protein CMH36_14365 [Microbacterium sp.]|uniref:Uncharacterized protein n=1 Tax=Microbacterium ginsengisoli TaxID=400772 RepID=A0A0F0LWH5_9MICO|nr:hypothetical protein [uncultured Microbacterium sp.]KJL38176.1 hypothetical protein RR49_00807 [Microbacterium ginsengisoli]MAL07991.1 hypothetical protein [Microbacterium sp.]MBN9207347.1 hypothetical protein [Microbacterium ginsengisoli]HAN24548.1 hypothetical protein [Microbacterium ginsengisoli]
MLVIPRSARAPRARLGDDGASLVAVVVVMLVGFVVAVTIAGVSIFAITQNQRSASSLQAFTAAESGRDAAVAMLAAASAGTAGCSTTGTGTYSGTAGTYTYSYSVFSTTSTVQPSRSTALGAAACPTITSTFVLVHAVGTSPSGATTAVDAVYPWAGSTVKTDSLGYINNGFSPLLSNFTGGDLVVRSGDFACNATTISGNVYVLAGNVTIGAGCIIQGSVYASGTVTASLSVVNSTVTVGSVSAVSIITGDITALGNVSLVPLTTLSLPGLPLGLSVGGGIHSGGNVTLDTAINLSLLGTYAGTVGGDVTARGTISIKAWKVGGKAQATGTVTVNTSLGVLCLIIPCGTLGPTSQVPNSSSTPQPAFSPSQAQLLAQSAWVDLNASTNWSRYTGSAWTAYATFTGDSCSASSINSAISAATAPIVINATACAFSPSFLLSITNVPQDTVLLVTNTINTLAIQGSTTATAANPRQLFLVQVDNIANGVPDCAGRGAVTNLLSAVPTSTNFRLMVYSPCAASLLGLGNAASTITGQFIVPTTNWTIVGNTLKQVICAPMTVNPNIQFGCKATDAATGTPIGSFTTAKAIAQVEVSP